jgi:hypothetical protein
MPIRRACEDALAAFDHAVSVVVIDGTSGTPLASAARTPGDVTLTLATSIAALAHHVPGTLTTVLAKTRLAATPTGPVDEALFQEGANTHFVKSLRKGSAFLVVAARNASNVGLAWVHVRSAALQLEALL